MVLDSSQLTALTSRSFSYVLPPQSTGYEMLRSRMGLGTVSVVQNTKHWFFWDSKQHTETSALLV